MISSTEVSSSSTWDSLPVKSRGYAQDIGQISGNHALHDQQDTLVSNHKRPRTQALPLVTVTSATSSYRSPFFPPPDRGMLQVPGSGYTPSNETLQNHTVENARAPDRHHWVESTSESSSICSSPTPIGNRPAQPLVFDGRTHSVNTPPPLLPHSRPWKAISRPSLVHPVPTSFGTSQMNSLPSSTPPETVASSGSSSPADADATQISLASIGLSDLEIKSMLFELVNDPDFEAMVSCQRTSLHGLL